LILDNTNNLTTQPIDDHEFLNLMQMSNVNGKYQHVAVGVSGGVDSLALCLLAHTWGEENGVKITALTVDHGLRKESAREAAQVKSWLTKRGIPHVTLLLDHPFPRHGIQAFARKWRFQLLGDWCRINLVDVVMLAHTIEDQMETICMRILADSGPEGLSGMRHNTVVGGLPILRPLLKISKGRLIATCKALNQDWIVDPSNQDTKYCRVKIRQLMPDIERAGLERNKGVRLASAMEKLRNAFDNFSANFIKNNGGILKTGIAWINVSGFEKMPNKFKELLLLRLLVTIGGATWPSSKKKITRLIESLKQEKVTRITLGGCVIEKTTMGKIWIYREIKRRCLSVVIMPGEKRRWDNRFEVFQNFDKKLILEPLGEQGWAKIKRKEISGFSDIFDFSMPFHARITIPVARSLDDSLIIPHFDMTDQTNCEKPLNVISCDFRPDASWACDLQGPKV
jgi:tRNA(Ile)-lysidine synthase